MSGENTPVRLPQGGSRLEVDATGGGAITPGNGVQASAIADLTGTVGTANGAMVAVPNPTDTPATADALRDDLVANVLPVINDDLADLQAKVNGILAALRGVGIIAAA